MAFSEGILKITKFGSTVLDPDLGSSMNFPIGAGKADLGLIRLPNGATYDPNTTFDAPIMPGTVSVDFVVTATSSASLMTKVSALSLLVGTRDTLYAESAAAVEWTCTARLQSVEGIVNPPLESFNQSVKLNFVQITTWTA